MSRLDPRHWLDRAAVVERHGRVCVVRDDLLEGGSKLRFLPFLTQGAKEIVYGGPFCGGAPLALSVLGRHSGQKITLFYARRKKLHSRQALAQANGANLHFVYPGYMGVVQARARAYAAAQGALFLSLGFDLPQAVEPFLEAIVRVRRAWGSPDEVWCATGSGMLARCLGLGFPDSKVVGIAVGLASRHEKQIFPKNVEIRPATLRFEQEELTPVPFPSCPNYDRKAWVRCQQEQHNHPRKTRFFWNVL